MGIFNNKAEEPVQKEGSSPESLPDRERTVDDIIEELILYLVGKNKTPPTKIQYKTYIKQPALQCGEVEDVEGCFVNIKLDFDFGEDE